jgi:hypothetical protein
MLKKYTLLMAPTTVEGGGAVEESDPSALGNWMSGLGNLDGTASSPPAAPPAAQPKKETDGKADEGSGRTGSTGLSGGNSTVAKPSENASVPPANVKVADAKPAADADAPGDADSATAKAAGAKEGEDDKEKWPRSSADWEKFKTSRKQEREKLQKEASEKESRIQKLEAQLKEVAETSAKAPEENPEIKARMDRLVKENEEMSKRLQVLDVTQHPKFQAHYESKIKAQKDLAKRIVGEEKATALETVLSLPEGEWKDQQLSDFVEDLPTLQKTRIGAVLNDLERINQERAEDIAKAGELKSKIREEDQTKAKETMVMRERIWNETIKAVQDPKGGSPLYQMREGEDEWNQGVTERIDAAKKLLLAQNIKPADVVRAALDATAFPTLLRAYQADLKERDESISKLEAQVAALSAAQPSTKNAGSASTGGETSTRSEMKSGQTPAESMSSFTKNLWSES